MRMKRQAVARPIEIRHHPVVLARAGSMNFVYLHVALFTVWMLFIESKPWPTLYAQVMENAARKQAR